MLRFTENVHKVEDLIESACHRSNRNQSDIKVIAVTKYVDLEATRKVLELGFNHIGENIVQNAVPKYEALSPKGIWHFIGRLQTNKVKYIIDKFDYIHSIDRLSLAKEINKRAEQAQKIMKCFIQVNVSGEESKAGINPEQLLSFSKEIAKLNHINIVGLMTMAPHEKDIEKTRSVFRTLREFKDKINQQEIFGYLLTELSMGMSNDFQIAIEEGATFVRLGSILMGDNE